MDEHDTMPSSEDGRQNDMAPRQGASVVAADAAPLVPARERAFALYCEGRRTAAIAGELGVSASTARRWVRETLLDIAGEMRAERVAQLLAAIEAQRALAAEAWEAYRRERAIEDDLLAGRLDYVRRRGLRRTRRSGHRADDAAEGDLPEEEEGALLEEVERPRHVSQGARYLGLALAAHREIARLEGLYRRAIRAQATVPGDGPPDAK